jgi:hypothetical protein
VKSRNICDEIKSLTGPDIFFNFLAFQYHQKEKFYITKICFVVICLTYVFEVLNTVYGIDHIKKQFFFSGTHHDTVYQTLYRKKTHFA